MKVKISSRYFTVTSILILQHFKKFTNKPMKQNFNGSQQEHQEASQQYFRLETKKNVIPNDSIPITKYDKTKFFNTIDELVIS